MPRNSDSSQASAAHTLSDDDMEKMVSDAVFFFLVADQKKSLVKKSDLYKHCDLSKKKADTQKLVLQAAENHLIKTFGIQLCESESKKGCYYLINALKENQQDEGSQHITWGDRENAHMALTFVILGQIFMSNGKVTDEQLFKCLRLLGIYQEEEKLNKRGGRSQSDVSGESVDPELLALFDGDIKKFVNDVLVSKQHYLKREKVDNNDPEVEVYEYSWGERARLEVKESDVLKMVCELYECEPRMFKEQYDKVIAAEGDDVL